MDLKEINISELGIEFKERGDEVNLKFCPFCESQDDGDFTHFSVNVSESVYNCVKCNAAGTYQSLLQSLGIGSNRNIFRIRQYVRPKNKDVKPKDLTFYGRYEIERGISAKVLEQYQVGEVIENGKSMIVYSYINEKGVICNRKYRQFDDKHNMRVEAGAELIYYGQNLLDFKKGFMFVCEGEDDCHALAQLGFENVVSVPQGAKSYSPSMHKINGKIDQIFLLYDNDTAGKMGAANFAEKAGRHKCYVVELPFKDVRDCLLNGVTQSQITDLIAQAKRHESDDVCKAGVFCDGLIEHYTNPTAALGRITGSHTLDKIFGGFRKGELTSVTGHTGTGKSTFGLNIVYWLAKHRGHCLVISLENRMRQTIQKMVAIQSQETLFSVDELSTKIRPNKSADWLRAEVKKLNDQAIWFFDSEATKDGYHTIDKIETVIDYAVKFHGVEFVLLDHLEYFIKAPSSDQQVHVKEQAMRRLKNMTKSLNFHMMLIVHPAKTQDRNGELQKLGLNSFKGASAIQQESDNVMIIHKGSAEFGINTAMVKIEKNRELGTCGEIKFDVLPNMNSYIESLQ